LVPMPPLTSGEHCLYICFGLQQDDPKVGAIHSALVEMLNSSKVFVIQLPGFTLYLGPGNLPQCLPSVPFVSLDELVADMNDLRYSFVFCGILVPAPGRLLSGYTTRDYMTLYYQRGHQDSGDQDSAKVDLVLHTSIGALVSYLPCERGRSCAGPLWPRRVRTGRPDCDGQWWFLPLLSGKPNLRDAHLLVR
jgi:hypothetical protein